MPCQADRTHALSAFLCVATWLRRCMHPRWQRARRRGHTEPASRGNGKAVAGMRCIHSGQNAGALGRELVSWGPWSIWPSPGQPCREMRHPVVNPVEPWASTPRNTIPCGQFRRALGTAKASQSANLLGKMLLGIQNAILYAVLRRCRSFSRAIAAQTSNGLTNHRPPLGTQCP